MSPVVPTETAQARTAFEPEPETGASSCAGCQHLLRHGTCGEPVAAGLLTAQEGFGIVWPSPGYGATCPARVDLPAAAITDQVPNLSKHEADRCHAPGWDDVEIAAFLARQTRFEALGRRDAEDVAERLILRDRDGDDRRCCLECTWLGDTGQCLAVSTGRLASAQRWLEPILTVLRQCDAFRLCKGLP